MKKNTGNKTTLATVVVVLIIGVLLRFFVATFGYNFDFESYQIVGNIMGHFGNVYAETTRYNYGPVWFSILGIFWSFASIFPDPQLVYRGLIIAILTLADIAIAYILLKKFGIIPFLVFFLNPISIIITGFHNQFDTLAIAVGLVACLIAPKAGAKSITRGHVYTVLLLGLSLMIKHIFFLLPLWFFLREKNAGVKIFMLLAPIGIFLLGFVPGALTGGAEGILQNVFLYKSFANAPILHALLSPALLELINPTHVFIALLAVFGFATMRLPVLEAAMWYLLLIVILSPAIANQYLAIASAPAAALGFVFFLPYFIVVGIFLSFVSREGLFVERFTPYIPDRLLAFITPDGANGEYKIMIFLLMAGAIFAVAYRYYRKVCKKLLLAAWGGIVNQVQPFTKLLSK